MHYERRERQPGEPYHETFAFENPEHEQPLGLILTAVERVALDYTSDHPRPLDHLSVADAERYLGEGHFPSGSMGPKIEAALEFLQHGGREVIITSIPRALDAVMGNAGTRIA